MGTGLTLHEIVAAARGRRRQLRLSQEELALRLGVSRTWVQAFERETGHSSIDTVLRLMDVLGLSLDFTRDGPSSNDSPEIDLDELIQQHSR